MSENLYTAIDIGTTKVCTLVAKVSPENGIQIVAAGHAGSRGIKKGVVINVADLKAAVQQSVDDAREMLGTPLPPAFVGITGNHFQMSSTVASVTLRTEAQNAISQWDVDQLIESSRPELSGDHQVVHVIPRRYQVDELHGIRSPVGLSGKHVTVEAHVISGETASLATVVRVVHSTGVPLRGLVMGHIASSEAVLTTDDKESGVVLADIGGGTCDVAIYKDGALYHMAAVPVAGQQFTSDVSIGLGVPLSTAEDVKLRHGSALTDGVRSTEMIEVQMNDSSGNRFFSQLWLNTLLRDRSIELIKFVMSIVKETGWSRMPRSGLVLTGGSASLKGLRELAEEYASCPARIGLPAKVQGLPSDLVDAPFATSIGLLLWGAGHHRASAISPQVSFSPSVLPRIRDWITRLPLRRPAEVRI